MPGATLSREPHPNFEYSSTYVGAEQIHDS